MKKLLTIIIALAVLSCAFALPGRAAGESLAIAFTTAGTDLPPGAAFTVDVKITPTGASISALRLYVLYDKTCFEWLPGETARLGPVNAGMFSQRAAAGTETAKYPAAMSAADRARYGVAVLQWCAVPAAGVLPAIPPGAQAQVLALGFRLKPDAPYAGGKIFLSTDYSLANTPWFYAPERAVDTAAAGLTVRPMSPDPVFSTTLTEDGGFIYGFPASMPQVGGASPWRDSDLSRYFSATNSGVLKLAHPAGYPLTGTGTVLQLWNAGETKLCGTYTLVVFGDVDGNFVIDFDDWAALKAMPLGPVGNDPFRMAADINKNGMIDAADLALLYDAARGAGTIAQTR